MANTIVHKRSSTSGVTPAATGLSQGELAINIADGRLYTKNNTNTVINLPVTSISGTYITPASGNFSNSLRVNGVEVSVSGHSHQLVPYADSLVTSVFNNTGSNIPKFSVVYINGGQGDQPTVNLAIADSEAGSSKTYGVTSEEISNMGSGIVIVAGSVTGLNTDQFNPSAPTGNVNGSGLWLSPTVSGGLTTSKPSAPNHAVYVATIIRTHQNEGVVEVRIQNGFELQELHNVAINGVTNGQFLQYNSGSGLWMPSSSGNFTSLNVNGTGVSVIGHTHTASNITDFNSSVSGLLPTIANSGDNRVLTSTGSRVGINAESNATFDGTNFNITGVLNVDDLKLDGSTVGGSGDVIIGPSGNIYLGALPSWPFGETPRSFGFNAVAESLYIGSNLSIGETADAPGAIEIIDNGSTHYIAVKNGGAVGGYIFIATGDVGVDMRGVVTITDHSDPGTGKLGIGTTSPSGALHVVGNAIVSSKIGINKENPAYALDVAGTGNFSQNLLINGTGVSISGHTHSASDITSGTISDSRLSTNIITSTNLYLWSSFR